jgi:hypothetical protein
MLTRTSRSRKLIGMGNATATVQGIVFSPAGEGSGRVGAGIIETLHRAGLLNDLGATAVPAWQLVETIRLERRGVALHYRRREPGG